MFHHDTGHRSSCEQVTAQQLRAPAPPRFTGAVRKVNSELAFLLLFSVAMVRNHSDGAAMAPGGAVSW